MGVKKVPVGVLLSGSGTNLQALIKACKDPDYPAEIAVVVSNVGSAYGLNRARAADLPAMFIGHTFYPDRASFEEAITDVFQAHGVEWVACAGFMRILTQAFLGTWKDRVLNIHPALLPAFSGTDGQQQAHDHGVRIAGATVHLVDAGTDTGPIVCQGAVPVRPGDSPEKLSKRILKVEHQLYAKALRWAVEGRLTRGEGRRLDIDLPEGEVPWIWYEGR
jgi:phosphoribosylglycinamide formyltransferase-1